MTRLYIVRHGNTFGPNDVPRRVGVQTDLPLVASGKAQAEALAQYLKAHNAIPDIIFISTLKRTRGMAEILNATLGTDIIITVLPMLDEIDYGPDENKTEEDVIARIGQDAIDTWNADATPPEGWEVDADKIRTDWQNLAAYLVEHQAGKTMLAITSNGKARFAPCILKDEAAFSKNHSLKMATGSVSHFVHDDTSWNCESWNTRPDTK